MEYSNDPRAVYSRAYRFKNAEVCSAQIKKDNGKLQHKRILRKKKEIFECNGSKSRSSPIEREILRHFHKGRDMATILTFTDIPISTIKNVLEKHKLM